MSSALRWSTVYYLRCGCGQQTELTKLTTEQRCTNCNWLLVYATDNPSTTKISKHVSFSVVRVAKMPKKKRTKRKR